MNPFVSFAYRHTKSSYLKRLLESIIIQTYKDFEVVITDDSDNDSVRILKEYENRLPFDIIK
jgi:glycosyltransferase involved in cell wall biosynthesis